MTTRGRAVVVTGMGVCCHLGDDLDAMGAQLRAGRVTPFDRYQSPVPYEVRCRLVGLYKGELDGDKKDTRFMGRAAHLAYKAARIALAQSGLARRDIAVIAGSGTSDVATHVEVEAKLAYNGGSDEDPARASRPYSADRAGFIFGEGAGILVLESRAAAEARGATILGTVRGFGMSSDGNGEMVQPSLDGALAAMRRALEHAGVAPDEIDYVNTHGTSTPLGDVTEVRALRTLLGGRHVPYSSTKGYTGHTVSGAGAI